jgi:hypothetical protein
MATRDPEKTARNNKAKELTGILKSMLPNVLETTGYPSAGSLHGVIGGKHAQFIDLKQEQIVSADHFIGLWLEGFKEYLKGASRASKYFVLKEKLRDNPYLWEYLLIFLERTYLRYYDPFSRRKPEKGDLEIWIGQNNASYGILITPRYVDGRWENDESEIRHFKKDYWTIGHILETGLVVPGTSDVMRFSSAELYLDFFRNVLIRNSGSSYEMKIAELYSKLVLSSEAPEEIPLLIPEYRYNGLKKKHKYRLDFCIFSPDLMTKVGFELSPWSSHGRLTGIKKLNQEQVNEMAKDNFSREMKKHREYFINKGVSVLIYTDNDLASIEGVFKDIKISLARKIIPNQLKLHIYKEFFS